MKKPTVTCVTISEKPIKRNLDGIPYVNRVAQLDRQSSLMLQTYRALELVNTNYFFMTAGEIVSSPTVFRASEGLIYGNPHCVQSGELLTSNNPRWNKTKYLNGGIILDAPLIQTSKALAIIRHLPLAEFDFLFALHYFIAVVFGAKYSPDTATKVKENNANEILDHKRQLLRDSTRDWIIASEYKIRESIDHA